MQIKRIGSKENKTVKYIKKLMSSSKFRKSEGLFAVEGQRLCMEALSSDFFVDSIFVSEGFFERNSCDVFLKRALSFAVLSDEIFAFLSDTQTPQGIMCICKMKKSCFVLKPGGKYIVLENLQDPSNMGAVFRSASAFGIDGILISNNSVDVYSPKVLRGTMGAVFKQPFEICGDFSAFFEECERLGIQTLACALSEESESILSVDFSSGTAAFIGNEGSGLSEKTISQCGKKCIIPMTPGNESLNASVAASIIMWEMRKNNFGG